MTKRKHNRSKSSKDYTTLLKDLPRGFRFKAVKTDSGYSMWIYSKYGGVSSSAKRVTRGAVKSLLNSFYVLRPLLGILPKSGKW